MSTEKSRRRNCEMAVALQGPHHLSLQYEEAVAVGAIIVIHLAGHQEMVLVVMLHSTTIMEVTAVVLTLVAMLCCHHSNILPRLATCSRVAYYPRVLVIFSDFPSRFSNQNVVSLTPFKHATCPTEFVFLFIHSFSLMMFSLSFYNPLNMKLI
jgi:hypothetical protein